MSMTESTETLTLYQMSIMTLCTARLLMLGFRASRYSAAALLAMPTASAAPVSSGEPVAEATVKTVGDDRQHHRARPPAQRRRAKKR